MITSNSTNAFRMRNGRLDMVYLRTCAIYRLLKNGRIDRTGALEIAARPVRGEWKRPDITRTIELWLDGPLRHRL